MASATINMTFTGLGTSITRVQKQKLAGLVEVSRKDDAKRGKAQIIWYPLVKFNTISVAVLTFTKRPIERVGSG